MSLKKNKTDLYDCYCNGVIPAIAYEYEFYINENKHVSKKPVLTGNDLHNMEGTNSDTHFIRMKTKEGKMLIGPDVEVNLTKCGIERFIIRPFEQETIDLHQCFCDGANPIITYKYLIKINREKYETDKDKVTKSDVLELVGKDPNTHRLRMFVKGGKKIIDDEIIDLTQCGVERFVVEALDCTEGFIASDTSILKESDKQYLTSIENEAQIVNEGHLNWLIIRELLIPDGYNVKKADVAIMIPPHYPSTQLDMIYFHPHLTRKDGKSIGALSNNQSIQNRIYQRWSRHRTNINRWDSEIDDLESHLDLMFNCLKAEFNKR